MSQGKVQISQARPTFGTAHPREKYYSGKLSRPPYQTAPSLEKEPPTILRRNTSLEYLRNLNPETQGLRSKVPEDFPPELLRSPIKPPSEQVLKPLSEIGVSKVELEPERKSTHRRPQFATDTLKPGEQSVMVTKSGQYVAVKSGLKNADRYLRTPSPEELEKLTTSPIPVHIPISVQQNEDTSSGESEAEPEKQVTDLYSTIRAYDGTPIYIVPLGYTNVVCSHLKAGTYGLDTESDCNTGALRIIQIYNGKVVFIFPVEALDNPVENGLIKFLKSKDRIKIGVDLDGDIFRLKKYVHTRRHASPEDQRVKYKFTVNGAIDVQNVAHTIGETSFSLDKLSHKYVEDFVGNPSELGPIVFQLKISTFTQPTTPFYLSKSTDL